MSKQREQLKSIYFYKLKHYFACRKDAFCSSSEDMPVEKGHNDATNFGSNLFLNSKVFQLIALGSSTTIGLYIVFIKQRVYFKWNVLT